MSQIVKASLDEMVFEERERSYGAYFLRQRYPRYLSVGTVIIALIASMFSFGPLLARQLGYADELKEDQKISISLDMSDLPPPPVIDENKEPPPPPPKMPPPQVKTVSFQIPEPTPEENLDPDEDQTISEIEELKEAPMIGLEDKDGTDEGVYFDGEIDATGEIPTVIVEREPSDTEFIFAEEEPTPVNMSDIKKLIGYPQIARDAAIEGSVVVRVLVSKSGGYTKHKVIKAANPLLSRAVEEHVNKLKFTPAIQGGKPIQFWVNIPFNFTLLN